MPEDPQKSSLGVVYSAVMMFGSSIAGCTVIGYFLDRWLDTSPYLSVTGLLIGTVGAFLAFFRIMSSVGKDDENESR